MKIAIVIEMFAPNSGGTERSTAEIAAEFRSRGHDLTILTGSVRPTTSKTHERAVGTGAAGGCGTLDVIVCPTGAPKGIARLLLFRHWAQRQLRRGYDASLSVTSAVPATIVQPRAGLIPDLQSRSLAWRHTPGARRLRCVALAFNFRQKLLRALEPRTFRAPEVKYIACVSDMIRRHCQEHYPDVAAKLVHIPNAVKLIPVTPAEAREWRDAIRAQWQTEPGDTIFLLPSLNSRRKGLSPLLHAMALLRSQSPQRRLILVVCGQVHPSQQRLIAELQLAALVRHIPFQHDLRPYYCAADVTVLPTYYDSFGRVVIESLLLGRPAITTAWAGAAELVQPPGQPPHGRVIADPDDITGLANAIRDLCDPEERQRCVTDTEKILQAHTIQRHVDELLKLFKTQNP